MQHETIGSQREPSLKEEARQAGGEAKAEYEELRDVAKESAQEAIAGAKQQVRETAETQRHLIGENLEAIAIALQASVDSLREQGKETLADYCHVAAGGVDDLASRLKDKPLEEMWVEAEHYVREQPSLAFGGAVAAGFLLSRFLKSSSPDAPARAAPAHEPPLHDPYRAPVREPDYSGPFGG